MRLSEILADRIAAGRYKLRVMIRQAPLQSGLNASHKQRSPMPTRTPLLGALRSLFRDAQIAKARGTTIEAVREARGVSRRTFLAW